MKVPEKKPMFYAMVFHICSIMKQAVAVVLVISHTCAITVSLYKINKEVMIEERELRT
jgi:hypothetical protein